MSLMTTLPVNGDQGAMTSWSNSTSITTMTRAITSSPSTYDVTTNASTDYVISEEVKERIVAISMIMACTLVGNLTLILILLCKRSRRIKRVNIFLINLAFGDLAVALFVNSTEILFLAFGDWVLGSVMCKVMVYVQMVCLASATNLLTAMTLDRYQVIVKPMETLAKRPRILLKIAIAWVLSLIFPLPQLFIFVQYEAGAKFDGTPKRICGSKGYTAPWQRKVYFTFTTTYILIVPMLIMLYCYARIIHVVWVRASKDVLQHSAATQQVHHHPLHHHHHHHNHNHHHPHNHKKHQKQHQQQVQQQQQYHQTQYPWQQRQHPKQQKQHGGQSVLRNPSALLSPSSECPPDHTSSAKTATTLTLKTNRNNVADADTLKKTTKDCGGSFGNAPGNEKRLSDLENAREKTTRNNFGSRANSTSAVKWAENVGEKATTTNKDGVDNSSPTANALIKKSGNARSSSASSVQVSVRRKMMTSSKRRVLTMTLSVVMSFFICHTPYFVLTLIRIYSDYRIKMETGQLIGEFMVMVHSTLNPLLYGLFTLRQKHLKHLVSLVSCFGPRRQRRLSNDDFDDNYKGEMYCLLRRRPVAKTTAATNEKSRKKNKNGAGNGRNNSHSNENSVISGYKTSSSTTMTNNNRGGSPSSLSTSASSSTTSLKSSILSRFRPKHNNNRTSIKTSVLSSCGGIGGGGEGGNGEKEKDDNSIGDSLLYSNADALDMCTVSTSGEDPDTSSCKLSPKSTPFTATNNETMIKKTSYSDAPSFQENPPHNATAGRNDNNCKQCESKSSFSPSLSSSSSAASSFSATTKQLPPRPPSSSYSPLLGGNNNNTTSGSAKNKRLSNESDEFVEKDDNRGSPQSVCSDRSRRRRRRQKHQHLHHHHHPHHHHSASRNKKHNADYSSAESSIVLTNPLVSMGSKDVEGEGVEEEEGVVRNGIDENVNKTMGNDSSKQLLATSLHNNCDYNNDEDEKGAKEEEEDGEKEKMDVVVESTGEKVEEEEEEEEEEIIPPVDFNSVPWEDEFIIGGLSRV